MPARVFLVGCPRSGTTLLQSLLSSHSAIHSWPETHFLQKLFRNKKHRQLPHSHSRWPARVSRQWHSFLSNVVVTVGWVGRKRIAKAWSGVTTTDPLVKSPNAWETHSLKAQLLYFVSVLDDDCLRVGNRLWLEKTPDHLFYVARIQRHVARAKFIHIVRDGKEVVASLNRVARTYCAWRPYLDDMLAVERWNQAWRETLSWVGNPNHLVVRYEALLERPRRTLAQILAFIGCRAEDEIWDRFTESARELIRADEPWKQGNLDAIRDCRKFMQSFDAKRRSRIVVALDKPDWETLSRLPRVVA